MIFDKSNILLYDFEISKWDMDTFQWTDNRESLVKRSFTVLSRSSRDLICFYIEKKRSISVVDTSHVIKIFNKKFKYFENLWFLKSFFFFFRF